MLWNENCWKMKLKERFCFFNQISLLFFKQIQPSTAWLLFQKHPLFPTSYLKLINTIYSLILFIFYRQPIWAKKTTQKSMLVNISFQKIRFVLWLAHVPFRSLKFYYILAWISIYEKLNEYNFSIKRQIFN